MNGSKRLNCAPCSDPKSLVLCPRTTRIMRSESGLPPAVSGVADADDDDLPCPWCGVCWHGTRSTQKWRACHTSRSILSSTAGGPRLPELAGGLYRHRQLLPVASGWALCHFGRVRVASESGHPPPPLSLFVMCIHINIYK